MNDTDAPTHTDTDTHSATDGHSDGHSVHDDGHSVHDDGHFEHDATQPAPRTTRHIEIEHHDGAPLAPDDPRVAYLRAAMTARAVLDAITPSDRLLPTPCRGWTVSDLALHVVAVYERVAKAPTGADVSGPAPDPSCDLDGAVAAIDAAMRDAHANWGEPQLVDIINAPWGPTPGAVCLGIWSSELLVHAWDLAVSIGATVNWPTPDVAIAAEYTRAGIPAERPPGLPFDAVVDVADDAPPIEQLVAWVGRDPAAPIQP